MGGVRRLVRLGVLVEGGGVEGVWCIQFLTVKGQLIIIWSLIMQFYSYSTKEKGEQEGPQQTTCSPNVYFFNHYCRELLEVSSLVNQELVKNHQLLQIRAQLLAPKPQKQLEPSAIPESSQDRSVKDNSEDNSTASRKNNSSANDQQYCQVEKVKREKRRRSKRTDSSADDQYEPDEEQFFIEEPSCSRTSDTKNIPQNYTKAIINFIRRNGELTDRVIRLTGTDREEFMESLQSTKRRLGTIAQLQWLWTDSRNKFAKVYRILSMEYLRKHSLQYIFNSRVNIYAKHIKYRYRIIECVKDPENFTHMKEF